MSLKPINIIQAAAADIKRRARNEDRYARGDNSIEQYAFLAMHVRNAESAADLIRLAVRLTLRKPQRAEKSAKRNTRLIYGNRDLLIRAMEIATGGESEQNRHD